MKSRISQPGPAAAWTRSSSPPGPPTTTSRHGGGSVGSVRVVEGVALHEDPDPLARLADADAQDDRLPRPRGTRVRMHAVGDHADPLGRHAVERLQVVGGRFRDRDDAGCALDRPAREGPRVATEVLGECLGHALPGEVVDRHDHRGSAPPRPPVHRGVDQRRAPAPRRERQHHVQPEHVQHEVSPGGDSAQARKGGWAEDPLDPQVGRRLRLHHVPQLVDVGPDAGAPALGHAPVHDDERQLAVRRILRGLARRGLVGRRGPRRRVGPGVPEARSA